jgi:DNA polymerase-3 subunit beta
MKVTVERNDLLKALSRVHRVVERRNTIPVLANVLLTADATGLSLKATDLDIEMIEAVRAEVKKKDGGSTTLPAYMFHDIVKKLPASALITLESSHDDTSMVILSGKSKFKLQSLPASDFPDLSIGQLTHRFWLDATALQRLLGKTLMSVSTDQTRYYLNGVYFHAVTMGGGAALRAVSTDGHRLSRIDIPAPAGAEGMPGIIIPRKTVIEAQRVFEAGEVTVELSETKIRLSAAGAVLTSKLIDGTFPDYERVVPLGNNKVLEAGRAELQCVVDRVTAVAGERGHAVKLSLSQGGLVVSMANQDMGTATDTMDVSYDADKIDIGFNSRYLLEMVSQLEGGTAQIKLGDPGSPALFAADGDAAALYVLMPMRA